MKDRTQESIDNIIQAVSGVTGVPVEDIKGKSRKRSIIIARHVSIYLIYKRHYTKKGSLTLAFIAEQFRVDHATVIHSQRAVKRDIETRLKEVTDVIDAVEEMLEEKLAVLN